MTNPLAAVKPMRRRDPDEEHRAATPLELLFDLTFVVAVAGVAAEFSHAVVADDLGHAFAAYLMVFFAIWWAWMNFTWFASAYDCDDALYRVMTAVQMAGVLILAAGVPDAFEHKDFKVVVIGYVVMRLAMIAQWVRAGLSDSEGRATAFRYAGGIFVVQLGWVARLALPDSFGVLSFLVLAAAELAVPPWAERPQRTAWHPEHIAERYGLFTIIVLGESVLATSNALTRDFADGGLTTDLLLLAVGGLVLLFAMWWIYFLHNTGEALRSHRELDFLWGYSHYAVFLSIAGVGAGLEAASEQRIHHIEASAMTVAMVLAGAISVYIVLVSLVHGRLTRDHRPSVVHACAGVVVLLALAWLVAPASLPISVLMMGLVVMGLVVLGERRPALDGQP